MTSLTSGERSHDDGLRAANQRELGLPKVDSFISVAHSLDVYSQLEPIFDASLTRSRPDLKGSKNETMAADFHDDDSPRLRGSRQHSICRTIFANE